MTRPGLAILALTLTAGFASASVVGFAEDFTQDPAGWRNFNNSANLQWIASGGPDGSAYATSLFNLAGTSSGGFPATVIRAVSTSSGGAFVGNWLQDGVTGFAFSFRHNLPEAITITGRFASPTNNPGASTQTSVQVAPNVWTTVSIDLQQGSPDIISFGSAGPNGYSAVFSSIGNIQIGFNVSPTLAGQNINANFDIDAVRIIPAPASCALVAFAGLAGLRRRRA